MNCFSDQIQIQDWEKNDEMFVSTRASVYVLEYLKNNSCLTLTGSSRVGKSFIARHTVLVLQKQEYKLISVRKPDDMGNYYQPGKQIVFIVDDICGNFTANQQQIESWQQLLPVINTVIADKCCKIIVSCRLQVYKDYKDDKFNILVPFKSCECNLKSDKLSLTAVEKNIMANTYIGSNLDSIDKLAQNSELFPLLCYLYNGGKHRDVKEFFQNPFIVYQNELNSLCRYGDEVNYKICILALLVLFNNQLNEKWFQGKVTNEQRHIIEDTCEACRLNRSTYKSELKEALLTLDGTFVYKQKGIYRTVHDKLFDFLAHYFGQKMIECFVDHGDSNLLHERFVMKTPPDAKNKKIPDAYLELYLDRLIKYWSAGNVRLIFENNNMEIQLFRQQVKQHLKQLDELEQVTLASAIDTVLPKEHHESGDTPLTRACYHGYTDMVQWMLQNYVDVNQCRDDKVTRLFSASQNGHTDVVVLLLERNSNVDLCDHDGCNPLHMASQQGHTDKSCC
ncbi:Hypothetical predicted protein [Mytilus galloprovincialis]|uniref:Novel STAND NTPase 3 domain-containing protein n=1 Tax=Mytilus galloprovincialis TaxID=29158 RepID=A0A8B6ET99_MYTGA|nr:Hypothetical predicted protein [Mytilus galloprovincialis]